MDLAPPRLSIVTATVEHARALAPRMRVEDQREVRAATGRTPLAALLNALLVSEVARTALFDGRVAAMYGVAPIRTASFLLGPRVGSCWMLTSDLIDRYPIRFYRHCAEEIRSFHALGWPLIVNAIDARHTKALRWASRVGFEIGDAIPYGLEGRPFHPIRRRA